VQRRLRDETGPVLAGRAATWDDLPLLGYARQVITETLRLYPPAWLLTRVTARDTELGGCPLPAGTILIYSAYLQHHRADGFPDPECFDPGRWADEQPPRGRYSPFGSGPRKCIGDTFALTQAVDRQPLGADPGRGTGPPGSPASPRPARHPDQARRPAARDGRRADGSAPSACRDVSAPRHPC
jgi:hypothetical protein